MSSEDIVPGSTVVPGKRSQAGDINFQSLGLLTAGHLVIDIGQGAIPAILPFLRAHLSLSYTAAGVIVLLATATSSLIQPLFGYLADRRRRPWILPIGVLMSSVGIAFIGLVSSYGAVLLLVTLAGLGTAAYHPEGYRSASEVAGNRKATGIALFSSGGNIGFALGPPIITLLITTFGLAGSVGMLVPGVIAASLLVFAMPGAPSGAAAKPRGTASSKSGTLVSGMVVLIAVVGIRSWAQIGFSTFLPFYYLDVMGGDPRMVGTLLGVFLGGGALGGLTAGPIADRFGVRRFTILVFLLSTPLAVTFFFVTGVWSFVVLGCFGFVLISTFTVTVVLAQGYMPGNLGMASGLVVGFAMGAGGVGVTALGWIADHWSITVALWSCALMPVGAFFLSLFLPPLPARTDD
jgi:FSR family fosmidomycin resistance protein-like MFS transporter